MCIKQFKEKAQKLRNFHTKKKIVHFVVIVFLLLILPLCVLYENQLKHYVLTLALVFA